jgi:phosphatidylethanolamine N-methyltransferase
MVIVDSSSSTAADIKANQEYESDRSASRDPTSNASVSQSKSTTPEYPEPPSSKDSVIEGYRVNKLPIGKTPDDTTFEVPETHDMVRSLFDPTLRKSYAEVLIFASLVSNFWIYKWLGTHEWRIYGFLALYAFWRLGYNLGIGLLLYHQSTKKSLVKIAVKYGLFEKSKNPTLLQKLVQLELKSKMGPDYKMDDYPVEFNTWIIFRQFVDLILMQDFTTYMFLVYTSGQNSTFTQAPILAYTRIILGSLLVLFNLWVKIDAHRVVKDYAWYWGDFFFLEENELIFDGVFNLSPHPMYSIGYIGYYGFALITKSYLVLIVSIIAHALQFTFLSMVEEPHIEKIYGNADAPELVIEELESNEQYLKPLINLFKNFNPIRITDYLTLSLTVFTVLSPFVVGVNSKNWDWFFFLFALFIKSIHSFLTSYILHKQSVSKAWTKLYLRYGIDNIQAFSNWQVLYNLLLVLSYSSLFSICVREVFNGQFKAGNWLLLRIILGSSLISLQLWTSTSIYTSIGEFGWFYGDFFLHKLSNKSLTKSGIYRYLNDPERLLGISGIWGATLITYSPFVFILAMIWTVHVTLFITFVEKPHMIKVYGEQQVLKNESGVSSTLKQFIPKRLNNTFDSIYNNTFNRVDNYIKKRTQSEVQGRNYAKLSMFELSEDALDFNEENTYSLQLLNLDEESKIEIGVPVKFKFTAPKNHGFKDWIGIYQILKTSNSRKFTNVSSSGKWVAVNPKAYDDRALGHISDKKIIEKNGLVSGELEFSSELLSLEQGIYELRYHSNEGHKVLTVSKPFAIVAPNLEVNDELSSKLLDILKNFQPGLSSVDDAINFKKISPNSISKLVADSTSIDIASEIVSKLRTISNISKRVIKTKSILDELNNDEI